MWLRHEVALANAIAGDSGLPADDAACRALAHFTLEAVALVRGQAGDAAIDRMAVTPLFGSGPYLVIESTPRWSDGVEDALA
jgi:hypothetical protein